MTKELPLFSIIVKDIPEAKQILKFLDQKGYLWNGGMRPTIFCPSQYDGPFCIYVYPTKVLTHGNSSPKSAPLKSLKYVFTADKVLRVENLETLFKLKLLL